MGEEILEEQAQVLLTVAWEYMIETFSSPMNICLISLIVYFLFVLFFPKQKLAQPIPEPPLPPLKRQDLTPEQLKEFDGSGPDGRVCLALNGKVFDVTKGKRFYGPGAPYEAFAGRDATRGLATFSVQVPSEDYDDISDLNSMQMESVREWEMQFQERYHYVGRLLKRGEEPTDYSDEDEANTEKDASNIDKDVSNTEKVVSNTDGNVKKTE